MEFKAEYGLKNTVRFLVWVTGWILNYIFEYGAVKLSLKWNTSLSFIGIQVLVEFSTKKKKDISVFQYIF